jgi:hypothetical protein
LSPCDAGTAAAATRAGRTRSRRRALFGHGLRGDYCLWCSCCFRLGCCFSLRGCCSASTGAGARGATPAARFGRERGVHACFGFQRQLFRRRGRGLGGWCFRRRGLGSGGPASAAAAGAGPFSGRRGRFGSWRRRSLGCSLRLLSRSV